MSVAQQILSSIGAAAPSYTITWQSDGGNNGTLGSPTQVGCLYPATPASGDLLVIIIGLKPATVGSASATTPSGWTLATSITGAGGYGVDATADTGDTNVYVYYKISDGTESGTLNIALSGTSVALSIMHRLSKSGGTWNIASATGQDTTGDATYSISFTSNPGVQASDYILVGGTIATDAGLGAAFSSPALSQTGVTFGTVTEAAEGGSSGGFDIAMGWWRAPVSGGTGSANPVFTATLTAGAQTNGRGGAAFVRIRAV